ncbi:hypothetical protein A2Y83_02515 [Candidatus Falkowbacteria bacterium RBG_13_39_14]|uniref:Uncharacterized protein n=1 Tax=Candidatus Falkowbacteria bacterium RBG_13_39_14 TaxID=1797985 RepID=A0A1F5S832_9BACT|nr:MAG: hypothetical protein A2Y83_02515 [Candidatus Falkowbacteria bacterium RBG_13_39_14]
MCVIPNAACGGGIPWRERWTRYSALIQGIPRRFAPRDDARTMCRTPHLLGDIIKDSRFGISKV